MGSTIKALMLDGAIVAIAAILAAFPIVFMIARLFLIAFLIMIYHGVIDNDSGTLLAFFYHALQISLIAVGVLYFGFYGGKEKPTAGMRHAGLRSEWNGKSVSRYCKSAAVAVILVSLVLLEALFEVAFEISIIGSAMRNGPWI